VAKSRKKPVVEWAALPAWAKWVAQDSDGRWFYFASPVAPWMTEIEWVDPRQVYARIPEGYEPKWEGDWKDSLVKRPEMLAILKSAKAP